NWLLGQRTRDGKKPLQSPVPARDSALAEKLRDHVLYAISARGRRRRRLAPAAIAKALMSRDCNYLLNLLLPMSAPARRQPSREVRARWTRTVSNSISRPDPATKPTAEGTARAIVEGLLKSEGVRRPSRHFDPE